jgi:predicted transcriptional regulator
MKKAVNVYLDVEDYQEMKRIADDMKEKTAFCIRQAIREYIAKNKKG